MAGHQCYHCKQWVEEGEAHDCWTTTESALTADLPDDLRDAWERLRETASEFGEQRIYASHNSIMFSRKACYLFVRPKKSYLEVCVFLGRPLKAPQVRRVDSTSNTKYAATLRIMHRDEVEPPVTEWLREAYEFADPARPRAVGTIDALKRSRVKSATSAGGPVARKAASRVKASKKSSKKSAGTKTGAKTTKRAKSGYRGPGDRKKR